MAAPASDPAVPRPLSGLSGLSGPAGTSGTSDPADMSGTPGPTGTSDPAGASGPAGTSGPPGLAVPPRPPVPRLHRGKAAWRLATADLRDRPDFVILGTQRGGTTSLYSWLGTHPQVTPALRKEIHYFDVHYDRGSRWYRSHFPFPRPGKISGEASPYMLFHPLAPERATRDLPADTRFIVLLREPVQRTLSHYWYSRRRYPHWELEPLERALALETERLAPEIPKVLRGERSFPYSCYSYVARSEYAGQLEAWFAAVGRERILVVESEQMYTRTAETDRIVEWLGLSAHDHPFPVANQADRLDEADPELLARLHEHFEPHNRRLFDLLGTELWADAPT
jgi:hypothetical protein